MSEAEHKTIRRAAAGDRPAFRDIVLEHSHAMFRLAWRLVGEEGVAEDVVQEAFIKAWNGLDSFRMDASVRSWLHRITVNTAMDHLRKQTRRGRHEGGMPEFEGLEQAAPHREDTRIDIRRQTEAALRQLSDTERAVLLLRHFEGHSIPEIAAMLEMTTGACKQAIFRAVKKMRAELQPLVTA